MHRVRPRATASSTSRPATPPSRTCRCCDPGADVIALGFGQAFTDLVVLVTEGRGGRFVERRRRPLTYAPERRRAGAPRRVAAGGAVPLEARLPPAGADGADAEVPRRRRRRAAAGVPAPARVPARRPAARRQGGRVGLLPRAVPRPRRAHDVPWDEFAERYATPRRAEPSSTPSWPSGARPAGPLRHPEHSTVLSPGCHFDTADELHDHVAPTSRRRRPPHRPRLQRRSRRVHRAAAGRSAPSGASRRRAMSHLARGSRELGAGGSASSCTTPAGRRRPACASCWPSPTSGWSASSAPTRRSRPRPARARFVARSTSHDEVVTADAYVDARIATVVGEPHRRRHAGARCTSAARCRGGRRRRRGLVGQHRQGGRRRGQPASSAPTARAPRAASGSARSPTARPPAPSPDRTRMPPPSARTTPSPATTLTAVSSAADERARRSVAT